MRSRTFPYFYIDATQFRTPGEDCRLEIYYDVSYSQLQFLKRDSGFLARFEIQVIVYDLKGRQAAGDSWTRNVERRSYLETVSPELSYSETFELAAPPGKYNVVVRTENLDSGTTSSVTVRLELRDFHHFPAISDLVLGRCAPDSVDGRSARRRVLAHPRARFGEEYPVMCVYGEIYDSPASLDTSAYRLRWRIMDEDNSVVAVDSLLVARTGEVSSFLCSPELADITMGRYTFEVQMGEKKATVKTEKTFEIDETRFAIDENIDDTMTLLSYIAPRSEVEALGEAKGEDRKRLWLEFWKRRDPRPETPENELLMEFFERVRYANVNFSYLQPGWKTDRGRIFIRRGPPDQVESRPVSPSGPPYEIWYYFQPGLTFIFVDRMGLGEYELVGPSYE